MELLTSQILRHLVRKKCIHSLITLILKFIQTKAQQWKLLGFNILASSPCYSSDDEKASGPEVKFKHMNHQSYG